MIMEKFPLIPSLFPNVPPAIRFIPIEEDYDPPFPEVKYGISYRIKEHLQVSLEHYFDIETNKQKYCKKFAKIQQQNVIDRNCGK